MALIFPKQSDKYVRLGGALTVLALLTGLGAFAYFAHPQYIKTGYQPTQPVPYSHKLHAGNLGMDCYYCHYTVTKAGFAAVPPTEVCMNCHVRVKQTSPVLQLVRDSYASGQPIAWTKIHALPDYVYFNHSAHVTSGVSCVSCHGEVNKMVEVKQVKPLSMAWCLDCHRNPAPNIRPVDQVTNLQWQPEAGKTALEIGQQLVKAKGIHPPQNCSGCHR
jgi:menaquinone reductase, multiheme cytochrome c subunit